MVSFGTIGGLGFAIVFKFLPYWTDLSFLKPFGFSKLNADGVYEIPFLDRMGFVFVICMVGMYIISMIENARGLRTHGLEVDVTMFKTNKGFAIGAVVVCVILTVLYTVFW